MHDNWAILKSLGQIELSLQGFDELHLLAILVCYGVFILDICSRLGSVGLIKHILLPLHLHAFVYFLLADETGVTFGRFHFLLLVHAVFDVAEVPPFLHRPHTLFLFSELLLFLLLDLGVQYILVVEQFGQV